MISFSSFFLWFDPLDGPAICMYYILYIIYICLYVCKNIVVLSYLPIKLNNTGKNIKPCAAPKTTILRYIRKKNTSKIWVLANANITIPIILVNVIPENTYNEKKKRILLIRKSRLINTKYYKLLYIPNFLYD